MEMISAQASYWQSRPAPSRIAVSEPNTHEPSKDRDVDQQLVDRAKRGDKKAFELLVTKYQRRIARLLWQLVRDPGEVEDLTQQAFIRAYRALPSFRADSAFYTWLYRIAINGAKNHLSAKRRRTSIALDDAEAFEYAEQLRDAGTPENELMSKQIAEIVNHTLQELPEQLRTAITLREIEGLAYEDIASIMDCPIGTVRSRIYRARETIAERLRPQLETSKGRRW